MRLLDLEPQFLTTSDGRHLGKVDSLSLAQGIKFLCPFHFNENSGKVGTHQVLVWFSDRGVPPSAEPHYRWKVSGTGYDDLSISPSIDLGFKDWHGWVDSGMIR